MALFNRDDYGRDYGYRGQNRGGGWGQRLRAGWNRVEHGVRDALDAGGYDDRDYRRGTGWSQGGGHVGGRDWNQGGGDWSRGDTEARAGWGGMEPMGPGFGDRTRGGGPDFRRTHLDREEGGGLGGYDRGYGGGYRQGGGTFGGSGNQGGWSGGGSQGGGGWGGGTPGGGNNPGRNPFIGSGADYDRDLGHRRGLGRRSEWTEHGREYEGPPVAGRDSMGLADRGGYARDYDRDFGGRGYGGGGYTAGGGGSYAGGGYAGGGYGDRSQTDTGDPFGDRQNRTPIRMIRGGARESRNWGQGMLGGGRGGYDAGYRGWNQGIGDEPYYNAGGTGGGYDRDWRGRDRDWF